MSTTFYKREITKGGRFKYVPVSEYDSELSDAFQEGTHLVVTVPGTRSRVYNINPDYATVLAVLSRFKTDLATLIVRSSEMRPPRGETTPEQIEAWNNAKKAFGDDRFYVTYPSAHTVIETLNNFVVEESNKLLTNPALKKAWDNFQTLSGLSK